jgi:ribosomal protein S21
MKIMTRRTNNESLDDKYKRLKNILLKAKNLQGKNC